MAAVFNVYFGFYPSLLNDSKLVAQLLKDFGLDVYALAQLAVWLC